MKWLLLILLPVAANALAEQARLEAPDSVLAGESLRIIWEGPGADEDYILVVEDPALDDAADGIRHALVSIPLNIPAPSASGEYELRYLHGDGNVIGRHRFQVLGGEIGLLFKSPVRVGERFSVAWSGGERGGQIKVDGPVAQTAPANRSPISLRAPNTPGEYQLQYVDQVGALRSRADLLVLNDQAELFAPGNAAAGATIEVRWQGPSRAGDFVAAVQPARSERGLRYFAYFEDGVAQLQLPDEPGEWTLAFRRRGSDRAEATRTIELTANAYTLSIPGGVIAAGQFTVSINGPIRDGDYLAITRVGQAQARVVEYVTAQQVQMTAPQLPGDYELSYRSHSSGKRLASMPLLVDSPSGVQTRQSSVVDAAFGQLTVRSMTGDEITRSFRVSTASGDYVATAFVDSDVVPLAPGRYIINSAGFRTEISISAGETAEVVLRL